MKLVLPIFALATSAMGSIFAPRGGHEDAYGHVHHDTKTMTTYTTTTLCPTTKMYTEPGTTYYKTEYYTSTIVTSKECHSCDVTVTGPDTTVTHKETDHVYITKYYPVTETKTVDGKTETVTWTSTKVVKTHVPKTETVYTSYVTTVHVSKDVHTTVTHPVETYTTVIKGSTAVLTKTHTKTKTVEHNVTVTEVLPVTKTKKVYVTEHVTVSGKETVTSKPIIHVTVSGTITKTLTEKPVIVTEPVSKAVTEKPVTELATTTAASAPVQFTGVAADLRAPVAAIAGAVAFAALA